MGVMTTFRLVRHYSKFLLIQLFFICRHALKRSLGINRKSRVSYAGPGFLSSATWPSLPKKHYNGLNETKPNFICMWYKKDVVLHDYTTVYEEYIFNDTIIITIGLK